MIGIYKFGWDFPRNTTEAISSIVHAYLKQLFALNIQKGSLSARQSIAILRLKLKENVSKEKCFFWSDLIWSNYFEDDGFLDKPEVDI